MFSPIETVGRAQNTANLRYRIRRERNTTRLYIAMTRELASQVKVSEHIKAWKLEIDAANGKGRLTGLFHPDGHQATREGSKKNGDRGTIQMSWTPVPAVLALFPGGETYTTITVADITSIGVEFILPVKAAGKAAK
jgi:hypothetical protein